MYFVFTVCPRVCMYSDTVSFVILVLTCKVYVSGVGVPCLSLQQLQCPLCHSDSDQVLS